MKVPKSTLLVLESVRKRGMQTALITNADVIETHGWYRSPLAPLFNYTVFSWQVGYAKAMYSAAIKIHR